MAEYIEREATVKAFCESCSDYVNGKCTFEGACDVSIIATVPSADVQPVDTKEILRHLDSMMICICNAYNTSHYLLESDMEFIEKQEKIIKELLEG